MSLLKYTLRRIAATVPILFGVMLLTFTMTHAMPGNPFLFTLGERPSPSKIAWYNAAVERYGLNDPIIIQFYKYFTNAMGIFWTWLIFAFIAGYIIIFVYKIINYAKKKIDMKIKNNSQQIQKETASIS